MLAYVLLFTFCSFAASQYTNVDIGISRFGFEFYKVIDSVFWFLKPDFGFTKNEKKNETKKKLMI